MSAVGDAFLAKARESLAGAEAEFATGRYNNAANRAYYACFQAAIAALELAGIQPSGGRSEWGHAFVQGQFAGQLVDRRKLYPAELRDALTQTQTIRKQADYRTTGVSARQASGAVDRARTVVPAVGARMDGERRP